MTHAVRAPILPADDWALVPIKLVRPVVGLKDSSLYERISAGTFPRPLRLSYRCSRFRAGDIRRWLAEPMNWHQGKAIDAGLGPAS